MVLCMNPRSDMRAIRIRDSFPAFWRVDLPEKIVGTTPRRRFWDSQILWANPS